MKALQVERKAGRVRRWPRIASPVAPGGGGARSGRSSYVDVDDPRAAGDGWHRVDRASPASAAPTWRLSRATRRRTSTMVSFPFVPGHEVVGRRSTTAPRVVIEPGARPRRAAASHPPFDGARAGRRRRLRPPRHRPPRARHPDRLLLLDRRRLGDRSSSPTRRQLHRVARRHAPTSRRC